MTCRLLILCDAFTPPLFVPRITHWTRHLAADGYECCVLSEQMPGVDFQLSHCRHLQMPYYRGQADKCRWLGDKLFRLRERRFTRWAEQQVSVGDYDVILCSSFNDFPILTATRLSRKYHKPLLLDLRDITEQWGNTSYMSGMVHVGKHLRKLYEWRSLRTRNQALREAVAVTTISPWHQQVLGHYNPGTHLIYNGYDETTYQPQHVPSEHFDITYLGRLYDLRFRRPHLLFEAAEHLLAKGSISRQDLRIRFFVEDSIQASLRELAQLYHIEDCVEIHSYVSREESIRITYLSSILLVLTCKATPEGAHGIMTTKFFEALGVEEPVLCVESDEECLAEVVRATQAGVAACTAEEVEEFVLREYHQWQLQGYTHQPVLQEEKRKFSRAYQANQIRSLIDEAAQPLVSIIVPVYNAAPYLKDCIDSILAQTYSHWELLLVDDGSTDESGAIIDRYASQDARIHAIHQANQGQSAARNYALSLAQGTYISMVDADDSIDASYLHTLVKAIPGYDCVQGGYLRVDSADRVVREEHMSPRKRYRQTTPWARLYRRNSLQGITFPQGYIYEDVVFSVDYWTRSPRIRTLDYSGYHYRVNPHSTTSRHHDTSHVFRFLHERLRTAPWSSKHIVLYTIARLRAHFAIHKYQ